MKSPKLASFVAALLIVAAPAAFAAVPWTGAAGAGVPDESNAGIYDASVGSVGYNAAGSTNSLVFRYVLTDTSATGLPGWTTLAVDGYDPGTSSEIRARLYRLTPGGTNYMITACTSNDAAVFSTKTCSLLSTVNFTSGDTYTLEVTVSRTSTAVSPLFRSVRLY
jgi:hypothetical protein